MNETKSNLRKWIAAALVIGAFLLADFLMPLAFEYPSEWPMAIVIGICIAQINLTAVWAAMAPGNVAVRLPWALMLSVFMWYALVLGFRMNQHYSLDGAVTLGVTLLFGVIVAQIPLWIASRVFRWRLVGWTDSQEAPIGRLQFQIWHMMLGTVFVALTLSPAKMVLPTGEIEALGLAGFSYILLAGAAVFNLTATIPCVWIAFWRRKLLLATTACWIVYSGLLTGIEVGVYHMMALRGFSSTGEACEAFLVFYALNLSQCGVVLGTLLIFRAVGLRLVRLPRAAARVSPGACDGMVEQPDT